MTIFPKIEPDQLIRKLDYPTGKTIHMVLDTDTFNEIDDQFAVTYALLSTDKIKVKALYAAPFFNELSTSPEDGMNKSYEELIRIRKILGREDIPIYRGSTEYLPSRDTAVNSEVAHNLVELAMKYDKDDPLYVVAIGAITNIASAILLEPQIIERIVVVWLGGNALHWPDTKEFNLIQDVAAAQVILDSGVPLILMPCLGVATHLTTTLSELETHIKGKSKIGDYLYDTYKNCNSDHYAYSRVIWDISVIAWLVNPEFCYSTVVHSPILSNDCRWSVDEHRHFIRYIYFIKRDEVFKNLFQKIKNSKC